MSLRSATAFRAILKGDDAKRALGIAGKQHQGRRQLTGVNVEEALELSIAVETHRAAGMTKDDAIEKVVADTGIDEEQIEYAHRRHHRAALEVLACVRALERDYSQMENLLLALAERRAKK